jgi:hypothetical protein
VGVRIDIQGGMSTVASPTQLPAGKFPYLQNVRRLLQGRTVARPPLGANVLTGALADGPTSLVRMNDTTANGPVSGYVLVIGAAGKMYVNTTQVETGLSGAPLSFLVFRPNASPQPWCYAADANAMWKVRSDNTTWKQGIAEPQAAPAVTFTGGGTGTTQIFYRYTYRSSPTGAPSNPSPESIAGTNAQASPSATVNATDYATKITFNATQWEFNTGQLRTRGGVVAGDVLDYVVAHNFGLSIPAGVNIDGIQIDLNWIGQNAGTGVLTGVGLYYLGAPIGTAKVPGIQNQSYATDTLQGGNADKWGATLTPDILNDPSFGFGVQIAVQQVGSTDRSFLNYFTITIFYSTQNASIVPTPSSDPQVDKIDFWRMGGALPSFTYVGTGPNTSTAFVDTVSDLAAVANPQLEFDNYEPFPSIDLPRAGTADVAAGVVAGTMTVAWVSGDHFNVRWLPGTAIIVGGVSYTLYNRPSSTTAMIAILETGQVVPSPGTGLTYEIPEPLLAAQPSPVEWGPTPDNAGSFAFAIDPNNPGDLVWTKGNNFDSAPDTNRLNVTSPNEPLMNGTITAELSTVFSTERFWLIYPNFADALSDVTGTSGQQWTLIQSSATRGLYMRYAIYALGSMIAYRAKDCIAVSMGGGPEQSITDDIYNLFPHGGSVPSAVTIAGQTVYPPDDTKPKAQTITIIPGYVFYNFQDVTATPRTLVYDLAAKGWSVDVYTPVVNCHSWEVGPAANSVLVGCVDGTIRELNGGGAEVGTAIIMTRSENGGNTRVKKRLGGFFLRAVANTAVTLAFYAQRFQTAITGFTPGTVTGASGVEQDFLVDFTQAVNADVLDYGAVFSWAIGSGNILSEYDADLSELPEQIIGFKTGQLSYGVKGWMTIPWVNLAYQSTANVVLVLTLDNGGPITLTFPSTSGAQAKTFMTLPPNKFKIAGWTANSAQPFTIYADDCEMLLCPWSGESNNSKPFTGFGIPGATT